MSAFIRRNAVRISSVPRCAVTSTSTSTATTLRSRVCISSRSISIGAGRQRGVASSMVNEGTTGRESSPAIPAPPSTTLPNVQQTNSFPESQPQSLQQSSPRKEAVRNAKPFSDFLADGFRRQHTYLRISITERCNLRCVYCMPEEGVPLTPHSKLLSTPEILHIANLFVSQGVTKIRLTGGEPTIRKDIVELVTELGKLKSKGLEDLAITSNGLVLAKKLEKLVEGGLTAVNLSLDTLEPWKFQVMTRRKGFENVMKTIDKALELGVQPLKINCVVMRGVNDYEILKFVELTREKPVEVRFIEYMPFDGNKWSSNKMVSFASMLSQIRSAHPTLTKSPDLKNETSKTYHIPGFAGKIGFITSMTHNFCGTCNRLRITSDGNLKVCLFGNEEVSLRDMMRTSEVRKEIVRDGGGGGGGGGGLAKEVVERESEMMERQMLEVIGVAVKGKREKHAGMGDLEHMKNRPMILIGNPTIRCATTTTSSWTTHTPTIPAHHLPPSPPPSTYLHAHPRFYSTIPKPSPPLTTPTSPKLTPRTTIISTSPPSSHPFECHPPQSATSTSTPTTSSPHTSHPPPASSTSISTLPAPSTEPTLTHLTPHGHAYMVPITSKPATHRSASASCTIRFSSPDTYPLISTSSLKKGDALSVARLAGISASKLTPQLIPLCHNILIEGVEVELTLLPPHVGDKLTVENEYGCVHITATVHCTGKTGVEMEALVAATVAGLNVYDMCKAVDRGMVLGEVRVVEKRGGRTGGWGLKGGRLVNLDQGGEGGGEGERRRGEWSEAGGIME